MTLKILPLESWMKFHVNCPEFFSNDDLREIKPILNKDGYFYQTVGKRCWFEYKGKAFDLEQNTQFLFELELLNHKPLSTDEINALKVLTKHKLISKEQRHLLYIDSLVKKIKLDGLKMKKTVRNFEQKKLK